MATHALKLKSWTVPNFATVEALPRHRQEGYNVAQTIPVTELSAEALSALAREWLTELYQKAGKTPDWCFVSNGKSS